nr:tripartite tricarboxylate transporter substrate binding protein [Pseudomonas sp.]
MTRTSARSSPSPKRRLLALGVASILAAVALPNASQAAAWPDKPVRLVVGFAPGGGTDIMARALAKSLTQSTGQTFLVENKPGASGILSASDVSRAAPDGYTFLVAPTSVETANPFLFKSDLLPSRDLTPVMGVGRMQMYVVARPTLEVNNLNELIAMTKSQPGKMSYASSGAGTPPHLAGELLNQSAGVS